MQTRNQKFAASIFEQVSRLKNDESYRNRYGAMAHQLPVLVRTAGLAQALAFVQTRKKDEYNQLLTDLSATIGQPDASALIAKSRDAQLGEYLLLTRQILDALLWYKRFAQSVLGVDITVEVDNHEQPS